VNSSRQEENNTFNDTYQDAEDFFGKPYKELQDYFINRKSKGAALDLGCGQGRDAVFLASIGFDVTAVDISDVGVLQMLKKAEGKKLETTGIVDDVLNARYKSKFDLILFDMLLHSFEKRQQIELLKKYAGILKENGLFCIVFPDDMETDYFISILKDLPQRWELRDEILIRDVPKIKNEETDFTFTMICAQLLK